MNDNNDDILKGFFEILSASDASLVQMNSALRELGHKIMGLSKKNDELTSKIETIKEHNEVIEQRTMALEQNQIHGVPSDVWLVQDGLGTRFRIYIGSHYVGKMLRIVGLAHVWHDDGKNKTVPTSKAKGEGFARPYLTTSGHLHHQWHASKTLKFIDSWLVRNGYWVEFVRINNQKDMYTFIKRLMDNRRPS